MAINHEGEIHHQQGSDTGGVDIPPEDLERLHDDQPAFYAGEAGHGTEPSAPIAENPDRLSGLSREEVGIMAVKAEAGLPKPQATISEADAGPDINPGGPTDNYLD